VRRDDQSTLQSRRNISWPATRNASAIRDGPRQSKSPLARSCEYVLEHDIALILIWINIIIVRTIILIRTLFRSRDQAGREMTAFALATLHKS